MVDTRDRRETVHSGSTAHWEAKIGLTNELYKERKELLLRLLRQKQPLVFDFDLNTDDRHRKIRSCLQPLMVLLLTKKDLERRNKEEWLDVYVKWASVISAQTRNMGPQYPSSLISRHANPDDEYRPEAPLNPYKKPRLDNAATQLITREEVNIETRHSLDPLGLSLPSSHDKTLISPLVPTTDSTNPTPERGSTPITRYDALSTTSMRWDTIEVAIDASTLGISTIWLPMIDLKPDTIDMLCHWKNFSFKKLMVSICEDIGHEIDTECYEFVYAGLAFSRQGGYKVALKRFVELGNCRGTILDLQLRVKASQNEAGSIAHGKTNDDTPMLKSEPLASTSSMEIITLSSDEEDNKTAENAFLLPSAQQKAAR